MKKVFESIKDFLYDSIDYIIIIGIIGAVAFIIGWRLDLLFAKETVQLPTNDNIVVENPRDDNSIDNNKSNEEDNDDTDISNSNDNIDENTDEINENNPIIDDNIDNNQSKTEVVKIVIPPGSLPSKIGTILEENKLISSKAEFVQKAQELKLDTKLKSGTFEISTNNSLEEIIKIIAK